MFSFGIYYELTEYIVHEVTTALRLGLGLLFSVQQVSLQLLWLARTPVWSGLHGEFQFLQGSKERSF